MRRWLFFSVLVYVNSIACSESAKDAPLASGGETAQAGEAAQAGQLIGNAGQGGAGGVATEPPVGVAGAAVGGDANLAGAPADDAGSAGTTSVPGEVSALTTSPLTLTPGFATSTTDYYVRCLAGQNQLSLTTTDESGTSTRDLTLLPDQSVSVADRYWIRCLPPDFPVMTVTGSGVPTPGYYLVDSAYYGIVFDTHGVPVWYTRGNNTINLDSPAVDTISLMPNYGVGAGARFEVRNLDSDLTTVFQAAGGEQTDPHEFQALPNGNHLLIATPIKPGVDLTGLQQFGANQNLLDCEIQELDPAGNLVWSWSASDHVDPVLESLEPLDQVTSVDVYHCNAIEPDASGNLLVSMRETNALFYIDRDSGQVVWKLGGSAYNKDGAALIQVENDPQTTFVMQHDARFRPNGNVTLFDDHSEGTGVARGVEYAIDHEAGVATPVFQYLGTAASGFEGGFRRYDDGESVIAWGHVPNDPRILTEIDADGHDVFDIAFADAEVNYRAIKVPLTQFNLPTLRATTAK
jgi:hypothetical protein